MVRAGVVSEIARRRVRLGAMLGLAALSGCNMANANWHDTRRYPGYVVPKRIPLVVDQSERAVEADHGGYIGTMVLTVREELGELGIESTILSPKPSRLPSPRVELIVRTFDEGSFSESYASSLLTAAPLAAAGLPVVAMPLSGYGNLAVLCRAYSPSNQLMFEGFVESTMPGTTNPRDMAEAVGVSIAKGLTDPESTRPVAGPPAR
jgi:hypothetical protein